MLRRGWRGGTGRAGTSLEPEQKQVHSDSRQGGYRGPGGGLGRGFPVRTTSLGAPGLWNRDFSLRPGSLP